MDTYFPFNEIKSGQIYQSKSSSTCFVVTKTYITCFKYRMIWRMTKTIESEKICFSPINGYKLMNEEDANRLKAKLL